MNSIFKISFISLLAAMSLFAACKKYDNNQPEINKDIKILSDWLKLNGDKFSKGIINIKESGNTLESRSLDWSQVKKIDSEQNEFFEIPFLSQSTGSLKSGIERNTSAENLYKEYRLIIQKKKSNGIITGRIKISIDGNLGNDALAKKINKIEFFDDLKAKRKRNYFCFTNRILPTRFYEKKISSVDIISNSTSNLLKPQLARNCIPISVPIIGYVCSGNQIGEDYNVSCGYENIGNRIVEECTDGDEGSDPFDYSDYWSNPRPTDPNNNPTPILPNQNIIDSLDGYPCAQAALSEMVSCNAFTQSILKDVFGVNVEVNIKFSINKGLPDSVVGQERVSSGILVDYMSVVELNPKYLTGSQDYIAATLIHESIHAFISYKRREMDSTSFKNMFPIYWDYRGNEAQHNEMANNYLNKMAGFLKQFNPSISDSVALALAWGGLDKTKLWIDKSQVAKDSINFINQKSINPTSSDAIQLNLRKCN